MFHVASFSSERLGLVTVSVSPTHTEAMRNKVANRLKWIFLNMEIDPS